MASRREFLQIGLAASALPIAGSTLSPEVLSASEGLAREPLYTVVFDERFPDSVTFGAEMRRLGAPTVGIAGDITDLWYRDLHARWKTGPVAIAGLTAHGPLFCLERLGWDHGMRVVFRADHRYVANGCIEHALAGPAVMLRQAADLVTGAPEWATLVAHVVARCPQSRVQASTTTIVTPVTRPVDQEAEPLISWVIAPRPRA